MVKQTITGDLKTEGVRDQIHCNPTEINRTCFITTAFRTDFFSTLLCMKVQKDTLCINTGLPYANSTTMVTQVVAVYGCSMAKPRQLDVGGLGHIWRSSWPICEVNNVLDQRTSRSILIGMEEIKSNSDSCCN